MDYFSILNLKQEPFSNSPDPDFFFHSREHRECLQKLELSILLRRGLNVIIGDVGTGKTTLCRQLIRRFAKRDEITTHLILDPLFVDAQELLTTVGRMLMGPKAKLGSNEWQIKEQIKQFLFRTGVKEDKTTVLIIDEGQKIPVFCLEILREFLNYETNEFKLLQIIIFAQKEFENTIKKYANFADRINLYHYLRPLNFRDTRMMIKFRLEKSKEVNKKIDIFSYPALLKIYRITGGYPRKIINLCHHCILTMIVQNRTRVSAALVRSCIKRAFPREPRRWKGAVATAAAAVFAAFILLSFHFQLPERLRALWPDNVNAGQGELQQNEPTIAAAGSDTASKVMDQQDTSEVPDGARESEETTATETGESATTAADSPATVSEKDSAATTEQIASLSPSPDTAESEDSEPVESFQAAGQKAEADGPVPVLQKESRTGGRSTPYAPMLGDITLKRNDTLSRVIQQVYGSYNSRYFRSLILANPVIDDPDRVDVGQIIYLPAIPVSVGPINQKGWWIIVDEKDNLQAAFDYLRSYPEDKPAVRMIPYWNNQTGNRFAIILKTRFSSEDSARQQLRRLPAELASQGRILSHWENETVFFANPFNGSNTQLSSRLKSESEKEGVAIPSVY
ncbi:MAG: AAA family ATPase [Desulfobacterales bacterium]|jgi:general secretion pathway protein A